LRSPSGHNWHLLAIAVLATASAAAAVAAADRPKFSLGVLRRDGVLQPFAAFDGHKWSVPWPSADTTAPLPISVADVPPKWFGPTGPDATWTACLADGTRRPMVVGKPVQIQVFCSGYLGLSTDYRGGSTDRREPTVPKDGLAVTGDIPILPITPVSIHSPDADEMIKAIADKFNDEEKVAAGAFTQWKHPWTPEERKTFPIELEAFYRARETTPRAFRTSYVEAVRKFPARPEDRGCGLITFVRGWVTEVDGKKPVIDIGARVTYCDRAEVTFIQPFGRLHIDKDAYWIYQLSSWRDEMYAIARVSDDEVKTVVAVAGGGCPKS
jgi:hypothetical protein